MSNLVERAGSLMIRMGGNTQEYAKYTPDPFDDGRITQKEDSGTTQTTDTPAVIYTIDLFYMAANISNLLPIRWFLGLPFNDTTVFHLDIAEHGQEILGDNLLALQAGNEPDLYGRHGKRPEAYSPSDYNGELHRLFEVVDVNDRIPIKNKFIAPSISSSEWSPEQVWDTDFIPTFRDRLWALTVERYPNNNCFAQFGVGTYQDPQENFPMFLTHQTSVDLMSSYLNSTRIAQEVPLPFIMFETNTASCGGFPGISQSYGAALWVLDYGFQMAHSNFSNAMLHVGGQNVYYNPWISPPTNQSNFNEWTVGSVFYSTLVTAEAFGKSDTARIVDLNSPSPFTPAYAIYERGTVSKFALFNFIDDPSGANNVNAAVSITGGGVPGSVRVKYLLANSVSSKTNITWAGQTFGNNFEADGRLKGDLDIVTVQCDTAANVCNIPLRAPSFALVFMDTAEEANIGQATTTFATTAQTRIRNTATIDPAVLATSNGHSGAERAHLGSTSHGSVQSGASRQYELMSTVVAVTSALLGGWLILSGLSSIQGEMALSTVTAEIAIRNSVDGDVGQRRASQTVWKLQDVYGQIPLGQTRSADNPQATKAAAYNDTLLTPPAVPSPAPVPNFQLQLQRDAANTPGLSIPHNGGAFWGFSIEMSVISQVLGKNSTHLYVPFLNLMSNLIERAGGVMIRLGGNTQEFATLVPELPDGHTFGKEESGSTQTTKTPAVLYTVDMFYMMSNISSMLNVKWFLGIPFNDSVSWRVQIAEQGQQILGDNLLGLQAGNEPDFYQEFGRRTTYSPQAYYDEVGALIQVIDANPNIPVKNKLIGPSVATGPWTPELVWETGFIDTYKDRLYCLSVEHYPNNNCIAMYSPESGNAVDVQATFPSYLVHTAAVDLVAPYLNSAALAIAAGKPLIMFETNTASCGGFQGISDSYGAALWALDYGFQMAYGNFTHGLLHVGGQNVFYNPFTSPPTNQSTFNQWTVGSIFYSTIILAEAFGKSNTSRIVDLGANSGSIYTPAYAIYENDALSKVALFNYVDDPSGASDVTVSISIPNAGVPTSIRVKYLEANSVSEKQNITWAGKTFGGRFQVDGRFKGEENVTTINCDQTNNACVVPVKAPGFALVFLDTADPALSVGQATQTFSTSAYTKGHNTATVAPSILATSNGHSGTDRQHLGSTSEGSKTGSSLSSSGVGLTVSLYTQSFVVVLSALVGVHFLLRH
ncbi:hypothetical protein EST38_g3572 [Candolleomyces aberdarensis]|uniref:Beta-glucuronidase C-terminal domain-containing protein n=1 Tax=Candolleomyces aberdarensis TaxID=2316362 RepID=A0A4Q2DSQ1_9AGAR|nr:hypothetical protein EST38_g3572 [Candolleomyces aberdarensis]